MAGLLTDTHCHLNLHMYQDLEQVLDRARAHGIGRILIPGIDLETSQAAVHLAEKDPILFAAVGIHPHDASTWEEKKTANRLRELAAHPKTVAIGEIGLDYYRDRSPRPLQRQVFHAQLELAAELGLPVIIHNRESFTDLWEEVSRWTGELSRQNSPLSSRPGVIHSYDGDLLTAQQIVSSGFRIGISGPVTFKNAAQRQEVAAGLALHQILIETDAPYLTPHPYRGRRNEPAYVAYVAEKVAELQHQPLEVVLQATWDNANELFYWGAAH